MFVFILSDWFCYFCAFLLSESSANNTTTITTTTNYPVGSTFEPSSSDVDTSTTIATTRSTMHAITSVGVIQSESSANNTTTITTTTNYPVGSTFEPSSSDVDTSTTIATTRSTMHAITSVGVIQSESSANNTTTITTTTNYPVGSTFEPSSSDVDTSTTIATTRSTMHAITSVGVIQSESSANNTTTITTTTNYPVGSTFEPSSSDVDTSTTIATTRSTMHAITSVGVIQSEFCQQSNLSPPENITITNVTYNSLEINWKLPSHSNQLNKTFYEILISSPQRLPLIIKNVSNCLRLKKRILNLASCSFYIIQIKIYDMLIMKSSDWSNPVYAATLLPQHAVQDYFEVENLSSSMQRLKWSKLVVPNECMAFIQLLRINKKTFVELTISLSINETEYTFYDLASSTPYTYNLKVISPFGNYLKHHVSITTTTLPHLLSINIHPPECIQISNITSTSFEISWSTEKYNESQFKISSYEVLINPRQQSSSSTLIIIKNISSELLKETIDNLTACTIYTIQMRSVVKLINKIYSEWSQPLYASTLIPNVSQKNRIKIVNLGGNRQQVKWTRLSDSVLIDECQSYLELVQYEHGSYNHMTIKLPVNESSFIFYNLKPLTTYTYNLHLMSAFGNINDIYIKSDFKTLPKEPKAPINLTATSISPNQVTIKWTEPVQHTAFLINCYLVYHRPTLNVNDLFIQSDILSNHSNEYIITSLLPGTNYTVYVKSIDLVFGIYSNASIPIIVYTLPSSK
ncbi:Collagen alpha-1(XIV) chain [Schistosoma japonicum]|nr:Collagen alpha-1(XIV) chain [Schistosoma japonicum]